MHGGLIPSTRLTGRAVGPAPFGRIILSWSPAVYFPTAGPASGRPTYRYDVRLLATVADFFADDETGKFAFQDFT